MIFGIPFKRLIKTPLGVIAIILAVGFGGLKLYNEFRGGVDEVISSSKPMQDARQEVKTNNAVFLEKIEATNGKIDALTTKVDKLDRYLRRRARGDDDDIAHGTP